MAKDKDVEIIRDALKAWHRFTYDSRWSGLYGSWRQAKKALEALERIEHRLGPRQLKLGEKERLGKNETK